MLVKLRKNIGLTQLDKEVRDTSLITLDKALNNEQITVDDLNFLENNHFRFTVMGETTIFVSREGTLFTEFTHS